MPRAIKMGLKCDFLLVKYFNALFKVKNLKWHLASLKLKASGLSFFRNLPIFHLWTGENTQPWWLL